MRCLWCCKCWCHRRQDPPSQATAAYHVQGLDTGIGPYYRPNRTCGACDLSTISQVLSLAKAAPRAARTCAKGSLQPHYFLLAWAAHLAFPLQIVDGARLALQNEEEMGCGHVTFSKVAVRCETHAHLRLQRCSELLQHHLHPCLRTSASTWYRSAINQQVLEARTSKEQSQAISYCKCASLSNWKRRLLGLLMVPLHARLSGATDTAASHGLFRR